MISQLFVLSPRGDTIISRYFRGDMPKDTASIFFQNVRFWGGKKQEAPPVFHLDGVTYLYLKDNGLYFMCTTCLNASAALVMEMLVRFSRVFKDYCGTLTEEAVRKNFVLIYELLDEMMDYGFPQECSSEHLRAFVYNKPVQVKPSAKMALKLPRFGNKTTPSDAVNRAVTGSNKGRNEIFVDIVERISVTFNASGHASQSVIDGSIQMKSFLSGNPEIRIAFNEELVIGAASARYGAVCINDCNFHESVRLDEFESAKLLSLYPPDGEFIVMNYRITSPFRSPFRVFPFVDLVTPYKAEVILKVRADVPEANYGSNVELEMPVPSDTAAVTWDWGQGLEDKAMRKSHHIEYDAKQKRVLWTCQRWPGTKEYSLRLKIALQKEHTASIRKEMGPVNMAFEIPMYNVSNLQVRYLRIMETSAKYNPYRWVRYVTKSSSYVCRI